MKALLVAAGFCATVMSLELALGEQQTASEIANNPPTILNGKALETTEGNAAYSYLVGGHLYGSPLNKQSVYSASSLLGNIPMLRALDPAFFVSLGDAIKYCTPAHYRGFRRGFLAQLDCPFVNAVGNHDVEVRERYLEQFPGPTIFKFVHGRVLHLVLDTELEVGAIAGAQLEWLLDELNQAVSNDSIASVAIYSHKLIWAGGRPEFKLLFTRVNNRAGYRDDQQFNTDVLPALRTLASKKQVLWFSGDVGVEHSFPLFSFKEPGLDLTWIATGLGDRPEDALIRVEVSPGGRLSAKVIRLDGLDSPPLDHFDPDFWRAHFKKG